MCALKVSFLLETAGNSRNKGSFNPGPWYFRLRVRPWSSCELPRQLRVDHRSWVANRQLTTDGEPRAPGAIVPVSACKCMCARISLVCVSMCVFVCVYSSIRPPRALQIPRRTEPSPPLTPLDAYSPLSTYTWCVSAGFTDAYHYYKLCKRSSFFLLRLFIILSLLRMYECIGEHYFEFSKFAR